MKAFLVILFVAGASCAPKLHIPRIIGGENAEDGQFPYQVSIHLRGRHNCGGSIISVDSILTAGHCLEPYNHNDLTVRVGSTKNNEGDEHWVDYYALHGFFNPYNLENDIGFIKILTQISYNDKVQPIPLQIGEVDDGASCVVSGWGYTVYPGGVVPLDLHYVDLVTHPLEKCKTESLYEVFDTNICTYTRHGEGTCHGDSGGPLAANGKQIGIVSWGEPCGVGYPDVFTKVSAYVDWINNNIKLREPK
ncbi:hypothetical protein FQA39_LY15713 [Lamprigera yunnana]|nr:hypothetical protein FQA39_LY15713 [Lamprigera yunnana]